MSWEYSTYRAKCKKCGHEGNCTIGSDDWFRVSRKWDGFDNKPPSIVEVARKKNDSRSLSAICECGSNDIDILEKISDH